MLDTQCPNEGSKGELIIPSKIYRIQICRVKLLNVFSFYQTLSIHHGAPLVVIFFVQFFVADSIRVDCTGGLFINYVTPFWINFDPLPFCNASMPLAVCPGVTLSSTPCPQVCYVFYEQPLTCPLLHQFKKYISDPEWN